MNNAQLAALLATIQVQVWRVRESLVILRGLPSDDDYTFEEALGHAFDHIELAQQMERNRIRAGKL